MVRRFLTACELFEKYCADYCQKEGVTWDDVVRSIHDAIANAQKPQPENLP